MNKFLRFFHNPRNLFILGFAIAFALTFIDVMRGRHFNFMIFADSTRDFWAGVSPYTDGWVAEHKRFFLYSPVFSVLFSPFAFLPKWLGPFAWNLFNYVMFYFAVFTLPKRYTNEQKCRMFMFTLPILAQSLLSFQYNVVVAYIFLFAYSLLERDKGFWAVLLIMVSGTTKIYGIFQLGLLLCYPHFWRNMGYAVVAGLALFALPLLKLAPSEFMPYYGEWFYSLSSHQSKMTFDSIYYAKPLLNHTLPYFRIIQMSTIAVLAALLVANRKKWGSPQFRAQALGILMGWVILFSDSAEKHTYIIALAGYMLWYFNHAPRRVDKWLLWANFFLLCIVPIDILFPVRWMKFICYTLWLNVWVFLFTWLRMAWVTFFRPCEPSTQMERIEV